MKQMSNYQKTDINKMNKYDRCYEFGRSASKDCDCGICKYHDVCENQSICNDWYDGE